MKVVVGKDGKLETVGDVDEEGLTDAAIRKKIAEERAAIRRMLDGNEQFHVDSQSESNQSKEN